jgi:hypothetical protein
LRYHYLSHKDTEKFINCSLEIEKDYLLNSKTSSSKFNSFKWFIASDSQGEIDEIVKQLELIGINIPEGSNKNDIDI